MPTPDTSWEEAVAAARAATGAREAAVGARTLLAAAVASPAKEGEGIWPQAAHWKEPLSASSTDEKKE
jgi:hypothetical protein